MNVHVHFPILVTNKILVLNHRTLPLYKVIGSAISDVVDGSVACLTEMFAVNEGELRNCSLSVVALSSHNFFFRLQIPATDLAKFTEGSCCSIYNLAQGEPC